MITSPLFHANLTHAAPRCRPDLPYLAIGDVHGYVKPLADALQYAELLLSTGRIDHVTFLGDLIDRGPDSMACLELVSRFRAEHRGATELLAGNHEQLMLTAIYHCDSDVRDNAFSNWSKNGGDVLFPDELALERWRQELEALDLGPDAWASHSWNGNVLNVHAGIVPSADREALALFLDLPLLWMPPHAGGSFPHWAWIREPFLKAAVPSDDYFIVHGHTPWDYISAPREGRLNVDGGSYKTGRIVAAVIDVHAVELASFVQRDGSSADEE